MYTEVIKKLIAKKISISTVESITGGLISKLVTDVPGSSSILSEMTQRFQSLGWMQV